MIALAVLGFVGGLACLFFSTPFAESFGGKMVLPTALLFFATGFGASVGCAKSKNSNNKARVMGITFSVLNGVMLAICLVIFMFYAFGHK